MKYLKSIVFRVEGKLKYYNLYNTGKDTYCALEISQGQYSVLDRIDIEIKDGRLSNNLKQDSIVERNILEAILS